MVWEMEGNIFQVFCVLVIIVFKLGKQCIGLGVGDKDWKVGLFVLVEIGGIVVILLFICFQ